MSPLEFLSNAPPIRVEYWADGLRLAVETKPSSQERFFEESQFFCCNECQSVWGFIYYPNRYWRYVYQDCVEHNTKRYAELNFPGSLLSPLDELASLPAAVLKREFELHVREFERRVRFDESTRTPIPPEHPLIT